MRHSLTFLALPLPAVLACAGEGASLDHVSVRDSAGIRIVENHTPQWTDATQWHLSPEPMVTIGGGAEPTQQLYQITAALRLGDGRIVIANSGTQQIKFFESNGGWLYDRGGEGGGPGEFGHLTWMSRLGADSLIIFDRQHRRWSLFDTEGTFDSNVAFDQIMLLSPAGVVDGGTILSPVPYPLDPPTEGEIDRRTFAVVRIDLAERTFDTVLTLRGVEAYRRGRFPAPVPFGRSTKLTSQNSVIYTADTERYEIRKFDSRGTLLAKFSKPHEPRPVTEEELDAYKQDRLAELPQTMLEVMGPALEAAPGPPAMPALGALMVDAVGNLWVQDYHAPIDSGPIAWSVFDSNGRWLGDVETPAGFTTHDIGDTYVLGVQRNSLDEEHVTLHQLSKG